MQVKNAPVGKHCDGSGLWLYKRADGGAQWILRVTVHGRRREMGLGSLHDVTLGEARRLAEKWRALVREGKDPIKERERLSREAARSDSRLQNVTDAAFEARKAELKGDGKAGRWLSPLELHVLPKLGKVPVEEIDQRDIETVLRPIWHSKAETARKALNRLGIVLKHGAAMGYDVDLQATLKAKALLGKTRATSTKIPALHWQQVPAFYDEIGEATVTQLALKLLILTAVRSGPLRMAEWGEIKDDVWTIPAEKMKSRKDEAEDFVVPLSGEAMRLLDVLRPFERDGLVFPSIRKGPISDMAMTKMLKDRGHDFRPHGFRSSFRTWCAEATDTPDKIAEAALAHSIGTKVQRSYLRTEYFERRKVLMERWSQYVAGSSADVIQLGLSHG
ncbi:integrase [Phaeobacter inhibens]|uniref:tyrosine-type recombinase/integrase n=1 Tax=Phaeobacter inhibens TaxID=221822 RepID=UPI0009717B70|nr:site-specific integrase [Phaeobacter inhibens]APX17137.1 integrase [Phaeobacter inhibens]